MFHDVLFYYLHFSFMSSLFKRKFTRNIPDIIKCVCIYTNDIELLLKPKLQLNAI